MRLFFPSLCLICGESIGNSHEGEYDVCYTCFLTYACLRKKERSGCRVCGRALLGKMERCETCSRLSCYFQSIHSLFFYSCYGGDLVRRYKFEPLPRLSKFFAQFFTGFFGPGDTLVPVPPLAKHQRQRGWDPVTTWVKELCRLSQAKWISCLARRDSLSQKTLDREKRKENAEKAFYLKKNICHESVWLIDDVVTTGATIDVCSRLLIECGAKNVNILCLSLH